MITALFVRHADIDLPPTSDDPPLNLAGQERARALAHAVGRAGITSLFTSPYLRTKQTLEPLASRLEVVARVAPEPPKLARHVLSSKAGTVVMIAGHSNTIPEMIKAFHSSSAVVTIAERDFDNLFVVTIDQAVKASLLCLKYGAPS